jgi:acetyl-CoA carboxylase biotin carboxyl carrier protein
MTLVQPEARPASPEQSPGPGPDHESTLASAPPEPADPGRETAETAETESSPLPVIRELREQALELVRRLDGPVNRIALTAGACTVEIEWAPPPGGPAPHAQPPQPSQPPQAPGADPAYGPQGAEPDPYGRRTPAGAEDPQPAHRVTAPLVGTFYRSPEPGAEPFVSVVDLVEPGQTLAIVEAMKLMNPITSELRARVTAVHPTDGEIVEYDEALFDLSPVTDED